MSVVGLVMHRDARAELALDDRRLAASSAATRCGWRRRTPNGSGCRELGVPMADLPIGLDLMLSLGGDGTMLRAVDLVADDGVPVLGVNLGPAGLPDRGRAVRGAHGAQALPRRFATGSRSACGSLVVLHRGGHEPKRLRR